jgi:hypothetical protein
VHWSDGNCVDSYKKEKQESVCSIIDTKNYNLFLHIN